MVVAMIPDPCDRVTGQHHGRAGCEHKFEPFRHFKPAMGQIAMQIKRCASSAPKKEHKHNRQIGDLKARQESDKSEQLQGDQDKEKEEIESFVLKHAAERDEGEAANRAAVKSKFSTVAS
jgi:septal ring factor EnvC (AmiA/AmiB activator)